MTYDEWCRGDGAGVWDSGIGPDEMMRVAFAAGVAAERERCATILHEFGTLIYEDAGHAEMAIRNPAP